LNNEFIPGTYRIFGEALVGKASWLSVNDYPLEFANVFCTELNSVEIGGDKRIRYSLMVTKTPTMPANAPLPKARYPKTPEAEKRIQRLLDAVDKKSKK
jgi:hypothetical protein